MFDFIRKDLLWQAWDQKVDADLPRMKDFHLKSIQDLAVYARLKGMEGKVIAEVGGGDSRVLRALASRNECCNIEKFEGVAAGPRAPVEIPGVRNVFAFLGEHSPELADNSFDVVFSVSVIEHVPGAMLGPFLDDGVRILKPGGLWLHAIDMYLEDAPSSTQQQRYDAYRGMAADKRLAPTGPSHSGPLHFSCDMASNPDDTMYAWGAFSPTLIDLRQKAQSVSLLMALTKA